MKTLLYCLLLSLFSVNLHAGVFVQNKLSFGTVVVTDNSVVSSVSMNLSDGKTVATNKMLVLVPGQLGEFTLFGFTPYIELQITADFLTVKSNTNGEVTEQFTLDSLTTAPTVNTDADGKATLYIGGTLSTSGNGNNNYINTLYKGSYNIIVTY